LIAELQRILELIRNRRSATEIQTYLSLNWEEISSLLRPQWEEENPNIGDPSALSRKENMDFEYYCWKYCRDLLAASAPPDHMSKHEWQQRLKDVEEAMQAEREAKDNPTPLSNHEIQQYASQPLLLLNADW
jgi:hypothetical protein